MLSLIHILKQLIVNTSAVDITQDDIRIIGMRTDLGVQNLVDIRGTAIGV